MLATKKHFSLTEIKVDLKENYILKIDNKLLSLLLKDRTTNKNLLWATSNYKENGKGFDIYDYITISKVTGSNGNIIKPRIEKDKDIQLFRIKKNAEVFTPAWICNRQNNLVDDAWFGSSNIFNKETSNGWVTLKRPIPFGRLKTWKDYVQLTRMEITCGEAPYLVSRYDTTTGELIPITKRIGLLDRKLRVISENTKSEKDWVKWAMIAYKNIYGYDYQGDNVLLARENLLLTFADYYFDRFNVAPIPEYLLEIANILSWNIWQMDGLKFVVPNLANKTLKQSTNKKDNIEENGIYCKIMDWEKNKPIKFISLLSENNGKAR